MAPAAPIPVPAAFQPAPGEQATFALKVYQKEPGVPLWKRRKSGTWSVRGTIRLALAGANVVVTGGYLDKDALVRQSRRFLLFVLSLPALLVVMVSCGLLMDSSAEDSTASDVGASVFLGAFVLFLVLCAVLLVSSFRTRRRAAPRSHVFPASAVTYLKLERYGSPGLLVFLLIFGGILPGWLLWRFVFSPFRQLRITAPFDPDEPSVPETYRLVARNKGEASLLAQALLPGGAVVKQAAGTDTGRKEPPGSYGDAISAPPPPTHTAPSVSIGGGRRRRRWPAALGAIAALVCVVAGIVIWAPWAGDVPATPTAVRAVSPTATSILIRWGLSTGGPIVDRYLILRDGAKVGSVSAKKRSYLDKALAPGSTHRYTVVAVSGTTRSHHSIETAVRTITPHPVGLRRGRSTISSVVFRWSRPPSSPVPDGYVIVRNGTTVGRVPGTTRSYKDRRLAPASAFRYRVKAVWGSRRSAPSAVLRVRTLAPPVSAARLPGSWPVRIKVTSTGGGTIEVGDTSTETWRFHQKCRAGACAVVVSGAFSSHDFNMTLTQSGADYSGTTHAHIVHCGSSALSATDVQNTLTLRITVKKGQARKREWVATSWVGSMEVYSPYTSAGGGYYCPAQSVGTSLIATR